MVLWVGLARLVDGASDNGTAVMCVRGSGDGIGGFGGESCSSNEAFFSHSHPHMYKPYANMPSAGGSRIYIVK